jgi:PDZ domain
MKTISFALSAGVLAALVSPAGADSDDEPVSAAAIIRVDVQSDESDDGAAASAAGDEEAGEDDATQDDAADDDGGEARSSSVTRSNSEVVVSSEGDGTSYSIEVESTTDGDEDGDDGDEPEEKTRARVIVVGPDGKRKVFELDGQDAKALRLNVGERDAAKIIQDLQGVLVLREGQEADGASEGEPGDEQPSEERFMIGVQCEEVGEALRSQLKLGEHGLIVNLVHEETPAAEAGLQQHDVIVAIDEKELESRDALVNSVTESEGRPLVLTVIRAGEKHTISVQPKKMKMPVIVSTVNDEDAASLNLEELKGLRFHEGEGLEHLPEGVRKMLEKGHGGIRFRVHPGLMLHGELPKDAKELHEMLERLQKDAQEKAHAARLEAEKAHQEAAESAKHAEAIAADAQRHAEEHTEKLHKSLRQLQDQIEQMQQQMEALQKQLEKQKVDEK